VTDVNIDMHTYVKVTLAVLAEDTKGRMNLSHKAHAKLIAYLNLVYKNDSASEDYSHGN